MGSPKLTLLVDVISPFAYLSYHLSRNSPTFRQCEITYIPVFLGGIMKACGNTAPLYIKNKDKWINKERLRWAHLFNIPVASEVPDGFPVNTILIQRALTALAMHDSAKLPQALDALYKAFWVDRNAANIDKADGLGKTLGEVLGKETTQTILAKCQDSETKNRLTENTNMAVSEGAFGLPYYIATNRNGEKETFWGFDHIRQVVDHLGLERRADSGWRAML